MHVEALQTAEAWLARALAALDPAVPVQEFLRTELSDARTRLVDLIRQAGGEPGRTDTPAAACPLRQAIDEAVTALRMTEPERLTAGESILLSKLLVIQSMLCTPRYATLR